MLVSNYQDLYFEMGFSTVSNGNVILYVGLLLVRFTNRIIDVIFCAEFVVPRTI